MGFYAHDWKFCSGACTILSQDLLKLLSQRKHRVNIHKEDDVVIGEILSDIEKIYLPRYQFDSLKDLPSMQDVETALTYPQIRIRNDHDRNRIDVGIWSMISDLILKNEQVEKPPTGDIITV